MPETKKCPECGKGKLERTASGIWECGKCGNKIAGGAYEPDTGAEQMLKRAKKEEVEELEEAKDELEVES
ncbi:MAG: hypothetical protein MUP63_01200 [Candidatus Nanohaloarchaeota archaeon QJJ-7]|nr:hypothetical protein [Candidatus Nanohaloarchaeota archaeon QJJ-7]